MLMRPLYPALDRLSLARMHRTQSATKERLSASGNNKDMNIIDMRAHQPIVASIAVIDLRHDSTVTCYVDSFCCSWPFAPMHN